MTSTYDSICALIKSALDNVYALKSHNHDDWQLLASNSNYPEKYALYVNRGLRLMELNLQYKPSTAISGTTQTGITVPSGYEPLGVTIRRSHKTGVDIGVSTNGSVYMYGSLSANANANGSIMWHY